METPLNLLTKNKLIYLLEKNKIKNYSRLNKSQLISLIIENNIEVNNHIYQNDLCDIYKNDLEERMKEIDNMYYSDIYYQVESMINDHFSSFLNSIGAENNRIIINERKYRIGLHRLPYKHCLKKDKLILSINELLESLFIKLNSVVEIRSGQIIIPQPYGDETYKIGLYSTLE